MEYHDYTFDEHFGKPTPTYLPRQDMLDYILARNSRDGALDNVKFSHTVGFNAVKYNSETETFSVTFTDNTTDKKVTNVFDRCIWAAGMNGNPNRPNDILSILEEFTGRIIHSSEVDNFENDVKDKRVLIVGDSCSAEDLALRAIRLGASHVFITARTGDGCCSETGSWPHEKITVIFGLPYKVLKGNGFKCQAVYYSESKEKYRRDSDEEPIKVKNIDTVVLATGYNPNMECLDESLQVEDEDEIEWSTRNGWVMEENPLTPSLKNIKPSKYLENGCTCYVDVYRCLQIENPKMMYILETSDSLSPILDLDVSANLVLGYLTGELEIPCSKQTMTSLNQIQLESEMQVPSMREVIDSKYQNAIGELDDDHWYNKPNDDRTIAINRMHISLSVRRLARDMIDCRYGVNLGSWNNLSDLGEKLVEIAMADNRARNIVNQDTNYIFRDYVDESFASIFTGTKSLPLPIKWLEVKIDEGQETKLANILK